MSGHRIGNLLALSALVLACVLGAGTVAGAQDAVSADTIPPAHRLQPAQLARLIEAPGGKKPLILQVGFRILYAQAHIPGSEYVGAAGEGAGLDALRARAKDLDRNRSIVIYCGCCPWPRCPNVGRAYRQLVSMGFKHVEVLYIADDFGTDWVAKGYPVEKGG